MKGQARYAEGFTAEVLKLCAVAVVLAIVASAGRTAIAPFVDRPLVTSADDAMATQLAYRFAASYAAPPEASHELQEPL